MSAKKMLNVKENFIQYLQKQKTSETPSDSKKSSSSSSNTIISNNVDPPIYNTDELTMSFFDAGAFSSTSANTSLPFNSIQPVNIGYSIISNNNNNNSLLDQKKTEITITTPDILSQLGNDVEMSSINLDDSSNDLSYKQNNNNNEGIFNFKKNQKSKN
jgi:hypothetical protein